MKVQNISSNQVSYEGSRTVSPKVYSHIKSILHRMNSEVEYSQSEYTFKSTILSGVRVKDKPVKLVDQRFLLKPVPYDAQMQGRTLISLGRTALVVDNKTGEIVQNTKPFYMPWFIILRKLEKSLHTIRMNFANSYVVQQTRVQISGFTRKGAEKLVACSKNVKYDTFI